MKIKKILIKVGICLLISAIVVSATMLGVYFGTKKTSADFLELPYTAELTSELITVDRTDNYLGHPDLVETDTGRLIIVYPAGHGRGQIIMKYSDDFGKTWSERLTGLPSSWANSQETPTIYNLKFVNGNTKLVIISGCPHWNRNIIDGVVLPEMNANGFNFSYSDDDGNTWSEFQNFHSPYNCIVAMSSLTQIKENGNYIDKWMGTFHDENYTNYKTYLTFDANGVANWSAPEKLLEEHKDIEAKMGICEIEIIRSTSDALILIARTNNRVTKSCITISYDEGITWQPPKETPYFLCGDRHKAEYDQTTGKVIISYRQIIPEKINALSTKESFGDGWVGWVGTFEELEKMATQDNFTDYGGKLYLLGKHCGAWCDCGYNGIVCKDGKALLVTYGLFDKTADNPYIVALQFDLTK